MNSTVSSCKFSWIALCWQYTEDTIVQISLS